MREQPCENSLGNLRISVVKRPRVKNIYIKVSSPSADVNVVAPAACSDKKIADFVSSKIEWINKSRDKILTRAAREPLNYESGERVYLWGRPYILVISETGRDKCRAKQIGEQIVIDTPVNSTLEERACALDAFYRLELEKVLNNLSEKYDNITNLHASKYKIRKMKSRWGTCNTKTACITINLQLVKKPRICLEYIIVHELCHLLEPSHNKHFYELVGKYYPAWRDAKKLLSD